MNLRALFATVLFTCALSGPASADPQTAAALRDRALTDPRAWALLESLTSEIGPRSVGTPAMTRARDWGLATLRRLGFRNVHVEEFDKAAWIRGEESAEVIAPVPQKLAVIGLGTSVSTPPEGIEAEIVVLKSFAELQAAKPNAFTGKIVVVNQLMTRTQTGAGYSAAVRARSGASEAAKRGAIAYLTRSISTGTSRAPHTGNQRYAADAPKIPAGALGVSDADILEALAKRGPVRIRLKLISQTVNTKAWNISGEITGSAAPKEIIVIGGHLDSWDPGTGAADDGVGIAVTTMAAKLIAERARPRRTIRVVMWGSEEQLGSAEAYLAAHRDEVPNIVLASECDAGAGRAYALLLPKHAMTQDQLKPLASILAPLSVLVSNDPSTQGGSDVSELVKAGVPPFTLSQDMSTYFDHHHSADDTMSIVDRGDFQQLLAAWTATVYVLANSDIDFRNIPAPPPTTP